MGLAMGLSKVLLGARLGATSRESEAPRLAYGGRWNLGGGSAGGGGEHLGGASARRSIRVQTAASAAGAGARRRQSPAGRSSAGDAVRREREQRERAAAVVGRVATRDAGTRDAACGETGGHGGNAG